MDIGLLIKQLRIQSGLTQKELLEGRYSPTYLSRIENGDIQNPSDSFLMFIEGKFGVSSLELGLEDSQTKQEKKIKETFFDFKKNGRIPQRDFLYLYTHQSQSYSQEVYLKLQSLLIRYYLKNTQMNEARILVERSHSLYEIQVEKSNTDSDLGYYLESCGKFYYEMQNFHEAEAYYLKAKEVTPYGEDLSNLFFNLSITKERTSPKTNSSLYYSEQAYQIFSQLHLEYKQFLTKFIMGMQYEQAGHMRKSEELLNQVKTYMLEKDDFEIIAKVEYNLGYNKWKQKEYSNALEHYYNDLDYLDKLSGINAKDSKFYAYRDLAKIFLDLNDFAKVSQYIEKGLEVIVFDNRPYSHNEILSVRAKLYYRKGETERYQRLMEKIIDNCIEKHLETLVKELSSELGEHYYTNDKYKKASRYLMNLTN